MVAFWAFLGAILLVVVIRWMTKSAVSMAKNARGELNGEDAVAFDKDKMVVSRICGLLDCDCDVLEGMREVGDVMKAYAEYLHRGRDEGFTPLIIVPSPFMIEILNREEDDSDAEEDKSVEGILSRASVIDANALLARRLAEHVGEGDNGVLSSEIIGEYQDVQPDTAFAGVVNFDTGRPEAHLIVAKLPTDKPWEAPAWIPMGGFNECPSPEEQVAVFKRWHDLYGAVPAVATYDIWQMYAKNPPDTKEDALRLALEQFAFCEDIVFQGVDSVNRDYS